MEEVRLLSLPEGFNVDQIQITPQGLLIEVTAFAETACCPLCAERSSSVHCHYQRTLWDVPCAGRPVRLRLTVRKFTCCNPYCQRKVFAERLPDFAEPFSRMTLRYGQQITSIGLATCGKGGARLAARLGIRTTRQTILRRIMALPDVAPGSVLSLGRDDFSFRRGCRFGTILVNLETRHVVDLLPDRKSETSAAWMRQQPDLMVVSRDRGGEYASAATAGAPQATQCADRFHLIKNLGEALEGLLTRHLAAHRKRQAQSPSEMQAPTWLSKREAKLSPKVKQLQQVRREERLARYQHVVALREQGLSYASIANLVGIGHATVQRWVAAGAFPEKKPREQASHVDPYLPYILERWTQGCRNMVRIHQELVARGYKGSYASVRETIIRLLPDGKKYPRTESADQSVPVLPHQASFLAPRVHLKNSMPKSKRLWGPCANSIPKLIWPMTWYSSLFRCSTSGRDNASMTGWTWSTGAISQSCSPLRAAHRER